MAKAPLAVVNTAVIKDNKICLLKRNKAPYKGYWALVGGKLDGGESLKEGALREAKEETGLDCEFESVRGILHERLLRKDEEPLSFILHFCILKAPHFDVIACEEGELEWFPLDALPVNLVLSDRVMIEEMMDGPMSCKDVIMVDEDGVLKDISVHPLGTL